MCVCGVVLRGGCRVLCWVLGAVRCLHCARSHQLCTTRVHREPEPDKPAREVAAPAKRSRQRDLKGLGGCGGASAKRSRQRDLAKGGWGSFARRDGVPRGRRANGACERAGANLATGCAAGPCNPDVRGWGAPIGVRHGSGTGGVQRVCVKRACKGGGGAPGGAGLGVDEEGAVNQLRVGLKMHTPTKKRKKRKPT